MARVAAVSRPPAPGGGIPLAALGYGAAFCALAAGDPGLDPLLPGLRRLGAVVAERRSRITDLDRTALWDRVESVAARLGAPPAVTRSIGALRAGAPCVLTGQQPGLFGGPAFTLYKSATAIALARRVGDELGEPVVPIFWSAADDADFEEVAAALVPGPRLNLVPIALDGALRDPDRMVGHLPVGAARAAAETARSALESCPAGSAALELAGPVWSRGRDWGEGFAACLYALFGTAGLVVVDAREPALRVLARPLLGRALDDLDGVRQAVVGGGATLEAAGFGRRQLSDFATTFPFWHEDGVRRQRVAGGAAGGEEAAARAVLEGRSPGALWAAVALRPIAADSLLPTIARVLGPAEVAYMAQIAPAYARLAVALPAPVPRLTATLVPRAAARFAAAAGVGVGELVTAFPDAVRAATRRRLPAAVREPIERAQAAERRTFADLGAALGRLDQGYGRLIDSVARKADFQLGRLWNAAVKREKSRLAEELPELRHLADFLRPGQGLQERRLAALGALALAGPDFAATLLERAGEALERDLAGRGAHELIPIEAE